MPLVVVGPAPVLRQIGGIDGRLKKNSPTLFIAFDSVYDTRYWPQPRPVA